MEIRCTICGQVQQVLKWQDSYERLRRHQDEPYICEPCQDKIRREAQQSTFPG